MHHFKPGGPPGFSIVQEALGQSEPFLLFQEQLSRVAPVDRPVLLIGERGTGKELAAARLHYLSRRWERPLVELNCAALNPALIESELFGHEKGAFTGAMQQRLGRFEAAHGGSLFLDEVGTIPPEVQEKILRVVEYTTFQRVGGTESVEVDVRIIAATNADLPDLVRKGRFKQDLLDRLSFEVLFLPPLRERGEDIRLLSEHFAGAMALELGWKAMPCFSPSVLRALERHPWPGNVRELKNTVERAVYRADSERITEIEFGPFPDPGPGKPAEPEPPFRSGLESIMRKPLREAVAELEVQRIADALERSQYSQKRAAGLLGLTYHQFRGLYRKHRTRLHRRPPRGS